MNITLIPGDGIGPEITESARTIVDALDLGIQWDVVEAGETVYNNSGELIPNEVYEAIKAEIEKNE